jgi:hypothetical protein
MKFVNGADTIRSSLPAASLAQNAISVTNRVSLGLSPERLSRIDAWYKGHWIKSAAIWGKTGRDADVVAKAALDPKLPNWSSAAIFSKVRRSAHVRQQCFARCATIRQLDQ